MKNLLFAVLASIILYGCSNESLMTENHQIETHCELGDIGLPQVQEGDVHNQMVDLLITEWSICRGSAEEVSAEIKRILSSFADQLYIIDGLNTDEFKRLVDSTDLSWSISMHLGANTPDFKGHIDTLDMSEALKVRLRGLVDLVEQADVETGAFHIQILICQYYEAHKAGLSTSDLALFGAAIDVASASCVFWLDSELGGQGNLARLQQTVGGLCGQLQFRRPKWSKIFLSDCLGIASGAIGSVITSGGLSALPNPALGGLPSASAAGLINGAATSLAAGLD
jgi:hypothetical protein